MFDLFSTFFFFPSSPQESPLRAGSSPPNSTGSTVDSDSWDSRFQDISSTGTLPIKKRRSFVELKHDCSYPSMLMKRSKLSSFLLDRKKLDKIKKKKKLKKREQQVMKEEEYMKTFIKIEPEDPLPEESMPAPVLDHALDLKMSPKHETPDPVFESCNNSMDSASVTMTSDDMEEIKTEYSEVNLGKRTVIRQGKQVVFRDEDGTGNDEDIMVDSGKSAHHEWERS